MTPRKQCFSDVRRRCWRHACQTHRQR